MGACAFFGHRFGEYEKYRGYIKNLITNLIEQEGITQFYTGGRGMFDCFCGDIVAELRMRYPYIKNTLVRSYMPRGEGDRMVSSRYDDSVYLLEERVLPKFAIVKTNEALVKKVDIVVAAVCLQSGGAWRATEYARRQGKKVINIYEECIDE